jgi:Protein phosphatase 2C
MMQEIKDYVKRLLQVKNIPYSDKQAGVFAEFVSEEDNIFAYQQIVANQNILITRFMSKLAVFDIINQHLQIPNGTVNKPYLHTLDLTKLGNGQITTVALPDVEKYGLQYDSETATLSGMPTQSGDFKINLLFNVIGEDPHVAPHQKPVALVINADPKSLWKDIPSDEGKDDEWRQKNYWKEDNTNVFAPLGNKHLVVASKRGRSHANVGSFRDDDFAFNHFEENGWSIVCVADGAGSAKLSRQGSRIACGAVIEYFTDHFTEEVLIEADRLIKERSENTSDDNQKELNLFLYNNAGGAALAAHKKLEAAANKMEITLKDLHSTLIFALFKQYEFGYAIFSFGVGDCPIGVLNKDLTEVKLMNWLDVGEFGGGTRFITMPEIFSSDKFATRLGFMLIPDFSYLVLMTDGIYDPKFVVEANLEKISNWQAFINDLKGNNDDKKQVNFDPTNTEIANELSAWMDFWSPGNHDDRTLAIVF